MPCTRRQFLLNSAALAGCSVMGSLLIESAEPELAAAMFNSAQAAAWATVSPSGEFFLQLNIELEKTAAEAAV